MRTRRSGLRIRRCGEHAFLPIEAEVVPVSREAGFDQGTKMGKRYDGDLGLDVLSKVGRGVDLGWGDTVLAVKKPLPC
jgi:hypothetical protein